LKIFLERNNCIFLILFISFFFTGCTKEHEKKEYVASVNDKILTQEELNNMMLAPGNKNFYKNEIIRNWINKELLYQEATKEGITSDSSYVSLLNNSKKELAVTLLLKKIYSEEKEKINNKEVEDFYNNNKENFKSFYETYVINLIEFNNENKAIRFRTTLLETDWTRATNAFKGDTSILRLDTNSLNYEYELQPASLSRIVKELNPNEVSIIFSNENNDYSVVQLVKKFPQGSLLSLEYVRDDVEKRLIANRKNELIKNYIQELYSKNEIEVKNQE